jgi:hypothetical protein
MSDYRRLWSWESTSHKAARKRGNRRFLYIMLAVVMAASMWLHHLSITPMYGGTEVNMDNVKGEAAYRATHPEVVR